MKKLLGVLILGILILAGCMQDEGNTEGNNDSEAPIDEKIVIEDAFGEQEFDKAPERVVVLEWGLVEEVLALGMQPVGVADIENFNKWVTIDASLDDSVVDVGLRTEPSIEEIAKLEPDVIMAMTGGQESLKEDLERIAPVLMYDSISDEAVEDLYAAMIHQFETTGKLLDKEAKAEEQISNLEDRMAEAAEKIEAANLSTNEFVFTQAFSVNQAPSFRLFTPNSTVSHVLEGMGLENKIQDQDAVAYGFIDSNVEGVSNYEDALFLHTVQEDDPLFSNLEDNNAWNTIQFVQEGDMFDVGAGVWTFGSVLSSMTLIENVEAALVN